ncbi:hypothetical protein BGZ76_002070 [Entomortierella beljakovae]|nr:hypothetical protein BGZ76_002070 [Entomortierella beljakovae]
MPAPAPGLQSISDLTTTSRITTGDIPPPLVGATMTIVDDKLYLFGGRLIQTRQMTNSLYILNLIDFNWQNVSEAVNVTPKRAVGDPGAEDENEMGTPPAERYFHSANTYKNTVVFFGGMGPSGTSSEGQSQELVVFDDVRILDLELLQWRHIRIPSSQHAPKPRYAHLSSISGSKLIIIGGQDINNQYIEEISVLDLESMQWTASMPFEKHCGSYRSIAVSSSAQDSSMPVIGSELGDAASSSGYSATEGYPTSYLRKAPSSTSLHYTPSLRKSSSNLAIKKSGSSRLSIGSGTTTLVGDTSPPSNSDQRSSVYRLSHLINPTTQEEQPVYIYSNFNFSDVKRELQVLNPPLFGTQDHSQSMSGNLLPPGLRFPTGAIAGQHLLLSGTYLSHAQQSFSIWSLNLSSLVWTRIDTGTVFSTGSWNRGILLESSNSYLVFGNRSRSLADDYQNRQTNFEHVSIVDLEAFGIYQHPLTTMTQTAQELGLSLLSDPSMADFEILTQDQQRIPVNSAVLSTRWPYFAALLKDQEEHDAAQCKLDNVEYDPTLSPKRTLSLPEPYTVVLAFLQYLYTDHLVTAQQHQSQVLSQLLLLADMYGLDRLRDLATHALHQMLNMSTAAMVYETAALSQQMGLQIRSLKVMIAAKKMLQQQQMKLQHQQAMTQNMSSGQTWSSVEIAYRPDNQSNEMFNPAFMSSPSHQSFVLQQQQQLQQHQQQHQLMQQQQQQQDTHSFFQPIPPPPLSPSFSNGFTQESNKQGGGGEQMIKNRGSVTSPISSPLSPQNWNAEPLTPPPVSPPPTVAMTPATPPATKISFFSFQTSKNKTQSQAITTTGGGSVKGNQAKKVPAFATMGVVPISAQSDAHSVKSSKSGSSTRSDN